MADPTTFVPGYSYAGWQATNPEEPLPAQHIDNDMANLQTSIDEIVAAVQDVRRSDGALKNGIVTNESLADDIATTITAAGTTVQPGSLLVGHATLTRRSTLPSADLTVSSGILLGAGHSGGASDLKTGYFIGGYKAKPTAGADSVVFTLPETGPRWSWQTIEVFRA